MVIDLKRGIPIAEETGQIVAIGEFVLAEACAQAARWNAAGHRLRISVNIAVGQLRTGDCAATVKRALDTSGLPPGSSAWRSPSPP